MWRWILGKTLKPHEYIGMVLDAYLRERAAGAGAMVINGLFLKMELPESAEAPYKLHYSAYDAKSGAAGQKKTLEVDAVIGADGANSRVAKSISAGDYEYAIAFQVCSPLPLLVPLPYQSQSASSLAILPSVSLSG